MKILKMTYCLKLLTRMPTTQNSREREREFIDTLNKHAPKKTKLFRGNQKPHFNKVLRSAIMKRSRLRHKANKIRKAVDIFNYKKQRNLVVKINNECKIIR